MISVKQAKDIIRNQTNSLPAKKVSLKDATGLTLAEDIFSGNDFPPFGQSAMDGYAFCFDEWKQQLLPIIGEIQAGATNKIHSAKTQAVRIFTGAPLPAEFDTVVMQEKASVENGLLSILDEEIAKGKNVRPQGSEIQNGSLALPSGTRLAAGAIGFVAGLGLQEVKVFPKPNISIIVTGKELQNPGEPLQRGQVYESNSYALTAALQQMGLNDINKQWADDDLEALSTTIEQALFNSDLLLLTGGVSVGDYDFVTKALEQNGVEKIFHKVRQKPGKPLYFGKKNDTVIFGLPGNPSSVLTCFYEYVTIAIDKMMNAQEAFIKPRQLPAASGYNKNVGLTHFLKGRMENGTVTILDAQESYKMKSFALANCLVVLDENQTEIIKGDMVEVHPLS